MAIERRLWRRDPTARALFIGAVGLAFLAAGLWLALAWLLSDVVDGVFLARRTLGDVAGTLAVMVGLAMARAGLLWGSEVIGQSSANRVKRAVRGELSAKLYALGPTYTRGERAGELVHAAVEGIEALDEHIAQYQPARLLAGVVPALVFVVILILDPWTLPILLFAGLLLVILLALIGGRAKELTARRYGEMAWMSAHFLDMLQGLATLKLFGRSKDQAATIETISRRHAGATMDVLRTAFQTSLVLEWGATAATALVAIEVSVRLMADLLPFERALTVLLLTPEFFLPLRQLAIKYHAGAAGKAAADRIFAILDTPVAAGVAAPSARQAVAEPPLPTRLDIHFDDVHVAYDGGQRPALNGFTLSIAQGQTVALVGATGAGKTTVANLLLRFVEPARGRITVGGVDLNEIDLTRWRALVAWAPQHPFLFHGAVADNIRLGKPGASEEEVVAAARAAHAHEFIRALPQGYQTPIGERGARLSGGQRQRLALARAFLKDAPLLILDEATSHLDPTNEELIRDALARLTRDRTVLIIAHRLTLVDGAAIVVMDGGRVVNSGATVNGGGMVQPALTAAEWGAR